jgi:hypothetical protein
MGRKVARNSSAEGGTERGTTDQELADADGKARAAGSSAGPGEELRGAGSGVSGSGAGWQAQTAAAKESMAQRDIEGG